MSCSENTLILLPIIFKQNTLTNVCVALQIPIQELVTSSFADYLGKLILLSTLNNQECIVFYQDSSRKPKNWFRIKTKECSEFDVANWRVQRLANQRKKDNLLPCTHFWYSWFRMLPTTLHVDQWTE